VNTSSSNVTRLQTEATTFRNRRDFQRSQLTEFGNTDFASWAKESFELARAGCCNGWKRCAPAAPLGGKPTDETLRCPTHGPVKPSTKGKGWYCPTKLPDGSWCKGK
jgi:hypothetical protein